MEYLRHWQFWLAVTVVAVAVNFLWGMFTRSRGQLV